MDRFVLFASLVAACYSQEARNCWTTTPDDIDWHRVPRPPWYDVVDIPRPEEPAGCWTITNSTETNNGIFIDMTAYKKGQQNPPDIFLDFERKDTGIYSSRRTSAKEFSSAFLHFLDDERSTEEEDTIHEKAAGFEDHDWAFLTDYENYLVILDCSDSGWKAYVKSSAPQITVEKLREISGALFDIGLEHPIMSLKNECLFTGNGVFDDADIVVV